MVNVFEFVLLKNPFIARKKAIKSQGVTNMGKKILLCEKNKRRGINNTEFNESSTSEISKRRNS